MNTYHGKKRPTSRRLKAAAARLQPAGPVVQRYKVRFRDNATGSSALLNNTLKGLPAAALTLLAAGNFQLIADINKTPGGFEGVYLQLDKGDKPENIMDVARFELGQQQAGPGGTLTDVELDALEDDLIDAFGVKKEEDEDEIVWEKPLSIPKALYRWDSKAAVANAVKNGIKKTGGPLDGIPTLATSSTAAAVNSGANDVSARMKIDTSKIPDFENNFRYTPTKKGPKEVKVMVSIPAEAITKV